MTSQEFKEVMESCPVIAAVKGLDDLEKSLRSQAEVIFVLFGTVCNIAEIVQMIKDADKIAMVHVDLIAGLNSNKDISVDFIKQNTNADGIITTHQALIKRARELELFSILRFFLLDSISLQSVTRKRSGCSPDFIEILPGLMPKIIRQISNNVSEPIIVGGLITDKEDIIAALSAGAVAISTTNESVWFM
ncbi:MAG: glycerol-3-phosphate responsive antiterminator [Oscillospiraceae bacterium]